eukprot:GEZU01034069.1.p1 GENE.GEZU01034069.1~~GEZU01034069.1.p1  ORF type:complete len:382 (+),score=88.87 GEZU01034069.1:3-1148(+)
MTTVTSSASSNDTTTISWQDYLRDLSVATGEVMQEGDAVIIFSKSARDKQLKTAVLSTKGTFDSSDGSYKHSEFIGKRYGEKIPDKRGKGFVYCLKLNSNLWTVALKHRTQILFQTDISLVTTFLELKPGSIVIESGTGSGSMSTNLAMTIAPTGHLYTYEFHEERAKMARKDFDENGYGTLVTVTHRDVIKDGFLNDLHPPGSVDAIFLDLPAPWTVIENGHVDRALKEGGMFCGFSPCIEQVQKTAGALRKLSFSDVRTIECLVRTYQFDLVDIPEIPPFGLDEHTVAATNNNSNNNEVTPKEETNNKRKRDNQTNKPNKHERHAIFHPKQEERGHTAYLTFARKMAITPPNNNSSSSPNADAVATTNAADNNNKNTTL